MVAGYVDGFGLLAFNTFLSFMSGNTTQTGANIGRGAFGLALPSAVAIAGFLFGVFVGNLRTPYRGDRALIVAVAAALAAACIGLHTSWLTVIPSLGLIAIAMGVMNTTFSRVGNEPVNLTFVTGALNKMGMHLAQALKRRPLDDAQGAWDTHIGRALLLTGVWAAFLIGATLAGLATLRLADWTLLPAAGFLLLIAMTFQFSGEHATAGAIGTRVP